MKEKFIEIEHEMLEFWQENSCFSKLCEKNKNGKPFRFLDGPITANNAMGIHHAWGRSIKDIVLRYKAMNGFSCHYRNGFDAQGLWVEVEVEKELGFKDKKDIESYGMENFTRKCVDRITKYSGVITEQSKRLGQWMNWDNSYFTHTDQNITSIWHFLKICNDNGWIAKSYKPMPWCPRCGTSLSEHEMTGSHKDITHTAVYVKVPLKEKDYDILVWTTTPWTLTANVALAVNPKLDYALVKCSEYEKPFILAKSALDILDSTKNVLSIMKGEELVGLNYETFLPFLSVQNGINHRIVAWEDVAAEEGSGVVHIAPGCGAEDFELGKHEKLLEICPVDEGGCFTNEYDFLSGKSTADAAPLIFEVLKKQGKLFKTHEYTHSYPVCWRCKSEVIFRLVGSWVIKTDEIRPKLLEAVENVKWSPNYAGKRMQDWLINMGDWNISRKRFYGLPLPFYPCNKCGHLTVIGSKEELRELGGEEVDLLPELHRPWIDNIAITCPKCGEKVNRVAEVGDVWLDAGITPFSTLGYFSDRDEWQKWFPIEWIVEMNEQIRLWFYSLLFMSVTLTGKAPYKQVMTYSSVVQEDGSRFHKSGYMIRFDEAAEKIGSDTIRYLYAGANTSFDVRFGYQLGDEARRKMLGLWNVYSFFMTYASLDKPHITEELSNNLMDKWLQSRIGYFVEKSKLSYDCYNTAEVIKEFESCIDDVSNWYVRLCRRRFWKESMDSDKLRAYSTLFYAIKNMCLVMAPITPFITEYIWQTMIKKFGVAELSVHLSDFPKSFNCDEDILHEVKLVRDIIAGGMKLRNESKIKVRQPLRTLYVDNIYYDVCTKYQDAIKDELNVKEIVYLNDFNVLSNERLSLNFKVAGSLLKSDVNTVKTFFDNLTDEEMANQAKELNNNGKIKVLSYEILPEMLLKSYTDKHGVKKLTGDLSLGLDMVITESLKEEGAYREILRNCQVLRKEASFEVADRVVLSFLTSSEFLNHVILKYKENIEKEALATICEVEASKSQKTIYVDDEELFITIG